MNRPEVLHIRTSPADLQFQSIKLLMYTLAAPKADGIKCYDAVDDQQFREILSHCPEATDSSTVVAQFSEAEFVAYNTLSRYLERYSVSVFCMEPNCKLDHEKLAGGPPPPSPTEEELEKMRCLHDEGCRKVVENYVAYVNRFIISSDLVRLYNRVQKVPIGEVIPDDLRREINCYIKMTYYKSSVVPLRSREDLSKVMSILTVFDEAESDDARSLLTQSVSPAPLVITLTRVQRRSRDRDYVLHCLAFFANLRFDSSDSHDGIRGRGSMYM